MSTELLTLADAKVYLRVKHDHDDVLIENHRLDAISEASAYLNKTLYEVEVGMISAIESGANAEDVLLVNRDINSAIAYLIQYHYYGESALGADKLYKSAINVLHPHRKLVGW